MTGIGDKTLFCHIWKILQNENMIPFVSMFFQFECIGLSQIYPAVQLIKKIVFCQFHSRTIFDAHMRKSDVEKHSLHVLSGND